MNTIKTLISICLLAFSGLSTATTINYLAPPTLYDNAVYNNSGSYAEWGQTFISEGGLVSGIKVYIGDPTRPGNPLVDELTGPADLVLYDASNLLVPIELARTQVLSSGDSSFGLTTFSFAAAIPTTIGNTYFFAISTLDDYGIGLRDQYQSTYSGGSQAWRNLGTGEIMISPLGRDLSFEVSTVPMPGTIWLFIPGLLAGLGFLKRHS